jgi:hypothetical protein
MPHGGYVDRGILACGFTNARRAPAPGARSLFTGSLPTLPDERCSRVGAV